ncbi:MAG: efflux RND transporter periplasmic adaptor subunit [Planctomycetaceae bacterium]
MSASSTSTRWLKVGLILIVVLVVAVVLAVPAWRASTLAQLKRLSTAPVSTSEQQESAAEEGDGHEGHDHGAGGDENILTLSREARRNIKLHVEQLSLKDYTERISLPGIVTEIPGQSRMEISAPLTGIVTSIEIIAGQTVQSGDLVFKLRLTHEDLVSAQTEFLRALGQLDVEQKEVRRLTSISSTGAVAGKVLLEKEYEVEKLESMLHAYRETLLLHGLTKSQVMQIESSRNLLRELTISVPFLHHDSSIHDAMETFYRKPSIRQISYAESNAGQAPEQPEEHLRKEWFSVKEILVHKGEAVQAGATLGVLTNYEKLYLEGHAYEQDMPNLTQVVERNEDISLVFQNSTSNPERLSGLKVKYLSNEVNPQTRTYHFYVELENTLLQENQAEKPQRFLNWKYKPGQRAYVELPVEVWKDKIVLPREAVVEEATSAFVFLKLNGSEYRRVEVQVLYRDRENAVLMPDENLKPGQVIAMRGARQMYMALERAAGGGGGHDHHGHSH